MASFTAYEYNGLFYTILSNKDKCKDKTRLVTPITALPAPAWVKVSLTGSLMRALTTRVSSSGPREQVAEY